MPGFRRPSHIFVCLEEQGILEVNNKVDLFCLHAVFTDQINAS